MQSLNIPCTTKQEVQILFLLNGMGVKNIFLIVSRPASDFSHFLYCVSKFRTLNLITLEVGDNRNNLLFLSHDGVSIVTRLRAGQSRFDSR
jgi:hypothetical protein